MPRQEARNTSGESFSRPHTPEAAPLANKARSTADIIETAAAGGSYADAPADTS